MWPLPALCQIVSRLDETFWSKQRLTKERSNEERGERNVDDGRDHVDEPVWQERRDTQEHDVVKQVLTVTLDLQTSLVG